MSILSQLGVIVLIAAIVFILIRSNRQLAEAAEEGEHFVDEWALREIRKAELSARKDRPERIRKAPDPESADPSRQEVDQEDPVWNPEEESTGLPENVVYLNRSPDYKIFITELDERRKPVRQIQVHKLPFTMGRAPENDLVIDDLCVARRHCRIIEKNHCIILEDEGSRNKLAVGGNLQASTVLKDHMYIDLGGREFLITIEDE